MATQDFNPLPPTIILSSKPISRSDAHNCLSAYIECAAVNPAYDPNSVISVAGPVSRSADTGSSVTLHNLKRVQAGFAGKTLGRDLSLAKLNEGSTAAQATREISGEENGQMLQEEQFEQSLDAEGLESPQMTHSNEVDGTSVVPGQIDKEERKRKKKERRQAERRAKAKQPEP